MIKVLPGDVYYSSKAIIFNPVSAYDVDKGFATKAKMLYPSAYNNYKRYIDDSEEIKLGAVQLIYLGDNRFMLNGFCITQQGEIDELALYSNLTKLCDLASEYDLSIGIQYGLNEKDPEEQDRIKIIMDVILEGMDDLDIEMYCNKE